MFKPIQPMPTNETHELTTIADLFRVVTMDNVDCLAADIRGILINAAATKAMVSIVSPEACAEMFESATTITWTDDNVNRQRITTDTGDGKALEFVTKGKPHKKRKPNVA